MQPLPPIDELHNPSLLDHKIGKEIFLGSFLVNILGNLTISYEKSEEMY